MILRIPWNQQEPAAAQKLGTVVMVFSMEECFTMGIVLNIMGRGGIFIVAEWPVVRVAKTKIAIVEHKSVQVGVCVVQMVVEQAIPALILIQGTMKAVL